MTNDPYVFELFLKIMEQINGDSAISAKPQHKKPDSDPSQLELERKHKYFKEREDKSWQEKNKQQVNENQCEMNSQINS